MQGFISYAHQNEKRVQRLKNNLAPLVKNGEVHFVDDHQILPGQVWDRVLARALADARLVLLCVSDYFLSSSYIYDRELSTAFRKHDEGTARVVPVILTYCDWQDLEIGGRRLGDLQAVPKGGKPIEAWRPVTRGYADAARRIKKAVRRDLAERR